MEKYALECLSKLKPMMKADAVGLSLNEGDHIVYVNDMVCQQLGYKEPQELAHLHPFMLSPEHQPDGQLSSTKAILMLRKAKILGQVDFPWMHLKTDKTHIPCHIHLFDVTLHPNKVNDNIDIFAIWQFDV